jgi:hypothetical protein
MPIQIEINDAHVDALIAFYIQRIKALRDEMSIREKELREINTQILKLKKSKRDIDESKPEQPNAIIALYSDKWPWVKKIKFAIELKGRALSTKQIVDILIEYETGLMFERKKAVASISSVLSTKSGADKEFVKIESDSGEFAYTINDKLSADSEGDSANPFD